MGLKDFEPGVKGKVALVRMPLREEDQVPTSEHGKDWITGAWSDEEDEALASLVDELGEDDWDTVAERMPKQGDASRPASACKFHWPKVKRMREVAQKQIEKEAKAQQQQQQQ